MQRLLYLLILIIILTSILTSCARMRYFPAGNVQRGMASWYGEDFHGKITSSKEIYNMYDMTAAHKTLPFGSYVMVTNLENGKSVIVRINDRGPFIEGRIIDLSYAAAKVLGMVGPGVVPVKVEVLEKYSPEKSTQKFSVQVGAFIYKENAEVLKRKLRGGYRNVYISKFETPHQTYYRVRIKARSLESAQEIAQKLVKEGHTVLVLEEQ
jgi:rare lipoprotein A